MPLSTTTGGLDVLTAIGTFPGQKLPRPAVTLPE